MDVLKKLAFCPTMEPYVEDFNREIDKVTFIKMASAGQVMQRLNMNSIDMALIGREAYKRELAGNIKKLRLKDGYTLVYHQKVGIPREQLNEIPVKTYLSKSIVKRILPVLDNVKFYNSLEECEFEQDDIPMLIDWKDFNDEYELLIPMDANGAKVPVFRAPVLFYNKDNVNEELLKKFQNAMEKLNV